MCFVFKEIPFFRLLTLWLFCVENDREIVKYLCICELTKYIKVARIPDSIGLQSTYVCLTPLIQVSIRGMK